MFQSHASFIKNWAHFKLFWALPWTLNSTLKTHKFEKRGWVLFFWKRWMKTHHQRTLTTNINASYRLLIVWKFESSQDCIKKVFETIVGYSRLNMLLLLNLAREYKVWQKKVFIQCCGGDWWKICRSFQRDQIHNDTIWDFEIYHPESSKSLL